MPLAGRHGGVMTRMSVAVLFALALQACSPSRMLDPDSAYFSSLFGEQSATCSQLRRELQTEIEGIKAAQKKADEDFIAEQSAPAQENAPPRAPGRKGSEIAALREVAKMTKHAEQQKLKGPSLRLTGCRRWAWPTSGCQRRTNDSSGRSEV